MINNLVKDIYALFDSGKTPTEEHLNSFGEAVKAAVGRSIKGDDSPPSPFRMSAIGQPCLRKLWYEEHKNDELEPFPPYVLLKFLYGNILEALLIYFAKESGHKVTGEQDELELDGCKGHRDCIIDGRLVDVKSATTYSFKKFQNNKVSEDDPFGYISQLNAYLQASDDVEDKECVSFLAVDKQLGHIVLDTYAVSGDVRERIAEVKEVLSQTEPPPRSFEPEEVNNGNRILKAPCSYCRAKALCHPDLRVFLYANGPAFLTKVVSEPKVPELLGNDAF